jgi:MSHA pilin protein MshC
METGRTLTRPKAGFTILEVVAVLLIMAVITAVALSRMSDVDQFDLSSQVEVVKNHLRYAQSRAMSSGSEWGIHFASGPTYYLFQGLGSTTPVILPGEDSTLVNLAAKNSQLTITPPNSNRVTFDGFGSPGGTTTTITTSGGNIVVTRNTGFIP